MATGLEARLLATGLHSSSLTNALESSSLAAGLESSSNGLGRSGRCQDSFMDEFFGTDDIDLCTETDETFKCYMIC